LGKFNILNEKFCFSSFFLFSPSESSEYGSSWESTSSLSSSFMLFHEKKFWAQFLLRHFWSKKNNNLFKNNFVFCYFFFFLVFFGCSIFFLRYAAQKQNWTTLHTPTRSDTWQIHWSPLFVYFGINYASQLRAPKVIYYWSDMASRGWRDRTTFFSLFHFFFFSQKNRSNLNNVFLSRFFFTFLVQPLNLNVTSDIYSKYRERHWMRIFFIF